MAKLEINVDISTLNAYLMGALEGAHIMLEMISRSNRLGASEIAHSFNEEIFKTDEGLEALVDLFRERMKIWLKAREQ